MDGPGAPAASACPLGITRAVITLVTLAAGIASSLPELAMNPRPDTPTAAAPRAGQGSAGGVPETTSDCGRTDLAATAGIGLRQLNAARAATIKRRATPIRT